jgi:serine/threonine protein kinase
VPQGKKALVLSPATILTDRFRIIKHIDTGRYGSVHLAEDLLSSMQIALKVTNMGSQCGETGVSQLKREMAVYSKITNFQHVIKVYGLHFVPWEGTSLLVLSMEYADGGTFRKWLIDHRKDLEARRTEGLHYFRDACLGIKASHWEGIVHHDVKPENLVFVNGVLKVSDFGAPSYGRFLYDLANCHIDPSPRGIVGTPTYMSPEFITGNLNVSDGRADIYSLGIILYELLNPKGLPPFWGPYDSIEELHLKAPVPELPEVGEKLSGIIARCLEKDPAHRYPTIEELLDDLEERPGSIRLEASTEEPDSKIKETWERASLSYSERDFKEATRLTEEVLKANPNHSAALNLKEELSTRFHQSAQFYQEIASNLETKDLSELIELLKEAVEIYPDHPAGRLVQAKLRARASQYPNLLDEGVKALKEERWEFALEFFLQALKLRPGAVNVRQNIVERLTRIQEFRREIDQALARGEYNKALRLARSVDQLIDQIKTILA